MNIPGMTGFQPTTFTGNNSPLSNLSNKDLIEMLDKPGLSPTDKQSILDELNRRLGDGTQSKDGGGGPQGSGGPQGGGLGQLSFDDLMKLFNQDDLPPELRDAVNKEMKSRLHGMSNDQLKGLQNDPSVSSDVKSLASAELSSRGAG